MAGTSASLDELDLRLELAVVAARVGVWKYDVRRLGSGSVAIGEASAEEGSGDVLGVLRKARVRSQSSLELREDAEEFEKDRMSGAV